jgi:hypothetical protein
MVIGFSGQAAIADRATADTVNPTASRNKDLSGQMLIKLFMTTFDVLDSAKFSLRFSRFL